MPPTSELARVDVLAGVGAGEVLVGFQPGQQGPEGSGGLVPGQGGAEAEVDAEAEAE